MKDSNAAVAERSEHKLWATLSIKWGAGNCPAWAALGLRLWPWSIQVPKNTLPRAARGDNPPEPLGAHARSVAAGNALAGISGILVRLDCLTIQCIDFIYMGKSHAV